MCWSPCVGAPAFKTALYKLFRLARSTDRRYRWPPRQRACSLTASLGVLSVSEIEGMPMREVEVLPGLACKLCLTFMEVHQNG